MSDPFTAASDHADLPPQRALEDLLPCDIVMAGGVTSGIIYPGAVKRLSRTYSFNSIGGTSVGAIAAAATAAAEYQRRQTGSCDGFEVVAGVPGAMAERAADGRSRLFHLFTPDTSPYDTRPMMALLSPIIGAGGIVWKLAAIVGRALRKPLILVPTGIVLVLGLWIVTTLVRTDHPVLSLLGFVATLALCIVVLLAMLVALLFLSWLPAMRRNGFGICTGLTSWSSGGGTPFLGLTPWMHETIQRAAGRTVDSAPLTFGDLWGAHDKGAAAPDGSRSIELSMMTSDISRQRLAQLPFLEIPSPLYIDGAMLRRYFPENVVNWMERHRGDDSPRIVLSATQMRLPRPEHLPVVFAARMSLSFPILLSALPLLSPDFAAARKGEKLNLRPVWYSDGGLTSNCPVHLFDSPLPSRPTFCLNLVPYESELGDDEADQVDTGDDQPQLVPGHASLSVARSQERRASRRKADLEEIKRDNFSFNSKIWSFIGMVHGNRVPEGSYTPLEPEKRGILDFASSLVNTARFWGDNLLLTAPGVRDRVVNIALRDDEGGLNLDMPKELIEELDLRGQAAGILIGSRFDPSAKKDPATGNAIRHAFPNHRWVRYRNIMAAFEDFSRRLSAGLLKSNAAAAARGEPDLTAMINGHAARTIGYPAAAGSCSYFHAATTALDTLARSLAAQTAANPLASFDPATGGGRAPQRLMRLFLRPLVNNDPSAERAALPAPVSRDASST